MPLSTINSNSFSTTANTNIDNGLLFLDVTNNRVGVRQTAPRHSLDVTSGEVGLKVTGSNTGYTQGAILLQSDTISSPQTRGQGVFLFNEGTDVNWYSGTFYTDADAWGVSRKAGASFDSSVADPASRVFKIDSSGRVTTPLQPRVLCIGANVNGTLVGGFYALGQASPDLNVGSHFNTTTRVFTCPIAGNYRLSAMITNGDGQFHYLQLIKNGSSIGNPILSYTTYTSGTASVIIPCAAGDTIAAGSRYNSGLYGAQLSIELVG